MVTGEANPVRKSHRSSLDGAKPLLTGMLQHCRMGNREAAADWLSCESLSEGIQIVLHHEAAVREGVWVFFCTVKSYTITGH